MTAQATVKTKPRIRIQQPGAAFADRRALADHILAEPCEPSVAMFFLQMSRRLTTGVKAYPHAKDPTKWCFRFTGNGLLEIDETGDATWIAGPRQIRDLMNTVVECARVHYAGICESESDAPRRQPRSAII